MFLTYRAGNCQDFSSWEQILDENVEMKLPITPYRFFSKEEIVGNQRRLVGMLFIVVFGPFSDSCRDSIHHVGYEKSILNGARDWNRNPKLEGVVIAVKAVNF